MIVTPLIILSYRIYNELNNYDRKAQKYLIQKIRIKNIIIGIVALLLF